MSSKDLKKIKKYERRFSRHKYNGSRKPGFIIIPGTIPLMISAPHAINQFREGQVKWADKYTGAIAILLHKLTGCHVIYASGYTGGDPNYDALDTNPYQNALITYVKENSIPVLIDLHGASSTRPYAAEMGTAPVRDQNNSIVGDANPSLKGHLFISKLLRLSFEYSFSRLTNDAPKEIWLNTIFDAGSQNTVTKAISSCSDTAAIQLEINGQYRDPQSPELLLALIHGLKISIEILSKVHWNTDYIDVFKLFHSKTPLPQDKVEFPIVSSSVYDGDMVTIDSFKGVTEHVHVKALPNNSDNEEIYLTKRLIHNVFSQEWNLNILGGAPILVSSREATSLKFNIGITTALQLDRVYLTSRLYNRLLPISKEYQFIVYNRLTDSRLYFDFNEDTDYHDGNRGIGQELPEKVMLPRYFKQLLGYNTFPFNLIRKEEFDHLPVVLKDKLEQRYQIIANSVVNETSDSLKSEPIDSHIINGNESYPNAITRIEEKGVAEFFEEESKNLFEQLRCCYHSVDKTAFYQLNEGCDVQSLVTAESIFKQFGFYDSVEILILPKLGQRTSPITRIKDVASRIVDWLLTRIIGKSEYLLTTCWTNETDDKNYVARLSPNMMSLLGITDNDKVVIKYGERTVTVRILSNQELNDYQIGIPANARTLLNMYSVNDVVVVSRDMRHTFKRNSQAQTIAILGTVLAVFQVIKQTWIGVVLCVIFIPLIIYFSLNEERIKVK